MSSTHYVVTVSRTVRGTEHTDTYHLYVSSIDYLKLSIQYKVCPKRSDVTVGLSEETRAGKVLAGGRLVATFTYTVGGQS